MDNNNFEELNAVINKRREMVQKDEKDVKRLDNTFEMPNYETINVMNFAKKDLEKMSEEKLLEAANFLTVTKPNGEAAFDSKKFLFQEYFKDVYIFGKRGIGKSYSTYKWIVDSILEISVDVFTYALEKGDRDIVSIPFYFGILLQKQTLVSNTVETFNEFLTETPNENMTWEFEIIKDKLILNMAVDIGSPIKFRKSIVVAEIYYLTLPIRARNRQHKNIKFMLTDEVEKAFATSLLDENMNLLSLEKLFFNFLDLKNSFARNPNIRWLYLGNITNVNSPLWSFLKIKNFNFVKKILEDKNGKTLIINIVKIYENEDFDTIYKDMTTQGIDESQLFNLDHIINENNVIENMDYTGNVLLTNTRIFYFKDGICNVEIIGLESMNKLNDLMSKEWEVEIIDKNYNKDQKSDDWLIRNGYEPSPFIYDLVPKEIRQEYIKSKSIAKIRVYNISRMKIEGSIQVDDKKEYLEKMGKMWYLFDDLPSYLAFQDLAG